MMRRPWKSTLWLSYIIIFSNSCNGFQTKLNVHNNIQTCNNKNSIKSKLVILHDSYDKNNNTFNVSKPTFDLLSLKSVRGDTLIQYSSLNQSEPLRINLYALLAASCLALPTGLAEPLFGENLSIAQSVLAVAGAGSFGALFLRECASRSRQIQRIEKELNAEYLTINFPDGVGGSIPAVSLSSLRDKRRVLAIAGSAAQLKSSLILFKALRKRLKQASITVIAIATDQSSSKDWGLDETFRLWLASPTDPQQWLDYFDGLSGSRDHRGVDDSNSDVVAWFGLKYNGRSFGSGMNEAPRLLELLGTFLQPTVDLLLLKEKLQPRNKNISENDEQILLQLQNQFYDALTCGKKEKMEDIFSCIDSVEVSEVLSLGGRIDNWDACLEDGARPAGMTIADSDVTRISDTVAYSTTIEYPPNALAESNTLLALQKWSRSNSSTSWKLESHQTIPWSSTSQAGGTLRCDCRGCVALARSKRNRTFGGLIG